MNRAPENNGNKATPRVPDQKTASIKAQLDEAVEHHRAGRLFEAEEIYRRILAAEPDYPYALCLLGTIAHAAGENDQAMDLIARAIAVKPDYTDAHNNLGSVLMALLRHEEALACFKKAIALAPENAEAHSNKGVVLKSLGRPEDAVASYRRAIEIRPEYAEAHFNLGNALCELKRTDEALASFQKVIEIKPDHAGAHNNLGNLYRDLDRMEEAVATYKNIIAINPDYAEAHHNLSFTLLGAGREDEGLDEFEWRWRVSSCTTPWRDFSEPMWDGTTDLRGKNLLLWPEQGLQDITIWASTIPELAVRAGRCIVQVYPKLVSLFARSFPEVEVRPDNTDPGADPGDFAVHLPMGSLFRALHTAPTSTVPAFLVPDPERVAFWKQRLADLGPGPYVGISWKSPVVTPDRAPNYTRIDEWAPLFKQPARFINLQCGEADDDLARAERELGITVHDFEDLDLFDDLDNVAALSAALDLSISVSTAVAAITAGVGTPTWVITWRQSTWNNFLLAPRGPEVTRFERDTSETWDAVFAAMAGRLRGLAEK